MMENSLNNLILLISLIRDTLSALSTSQQHNDIIRDFIFLSVRNSLLISESTECLDVIRGTVSLYKTRRVWRGNQYRKNRTSSR